MTVPPVPLFPEELHCRKVCGHRLVLHGARGGGGGGASRRCCEVGEPLLHGVGPMPLPALQGCFDGLYPQGHQWYWRADFVRELPDEAIDAARASSASRCRRCSRPMHLYPIDGAVHDVGPADTPFSYRDATLGRR